MRKIQLMKWEELVPRSPAKALVEEVDLMIIRYDDQVSVLYGRCPHRGVLLANGVVLGKKVICGWHGWDFQYETGASGQRCPALEKFDAWVEDDYLCVDADQISAWKQANPQPYTVAKNPSDRAS